MIQAGQHFLNQAFRRGVLAISPLMVLVQSPVQAAERIYARYGSMEISVPVSSLTDYVETGAVNSDLQPYFNLLRLEQENSEKLRELLQRRFSLKPEQLENFFKTGFGRTLAEELGELIQQSGENLALNPTQNGASAIESALIQAAETPEGLSIINAFNYFPGEIHIDAARVLGLLQQIQAAEAATETLVETLEQQTVVTAATESSMNFPLDLRQPGRFKPNKETFVLEVPSALNSGENRKLIADLYLDPNLLNQPNKIPVIIVSPGLGATRNGWQALIQHLASHGFAVVTVQHPGSNFQQLKEFFAGTETEFFKVEEFVERPQDISQILDELERQNPIKFQNKLDLNRVGIAGQSFGAYTALALIGAEIDFQHLEQTCQTPLELLNPSQLFQCQARLLPERDYGLKDDRIVAAFVLDTVSQTIFGQQSLSQVQLPVLWAGGSNDQLTPFALEQARSFAALPPEDKYLALVTGTQHLELNTDALSTVQSLDEASLNQLVDRDIPVAESYMNALSLAFFQVYLVEDSRYLPYLSASYAQSISEPPYTLSFSRQLTMEQIEAAFDSVRN